MTERFLDVGDVEISYETFGDPQDPAMLLVMGLGTQMLGWHEDFCELLAARGFHVIRFDNRDCGRSTHFTGVRPPGVRELLTRDIRDPAYTLADMAGDAAGLLDGLGIERAHVAGASMGGMIAQTLAARHPERVKSLASIMSSTGGRWVGMPSVRLLPIFLTRPPRGRDAYAEHVVRLFGRIGSPEFEVDPDELRSRARRSFDRSSTGGAAGTGRQLAAVLASGDRTAELRSITAPTVVIHGKVDRLLPISGGRATARAIPGARMIEIPGMGHDLPRPLWRQLVDYIVQNADRAGDRAGTAQAA